MNDNRPPALADAVRRGARRIGDVHGRDTRAEFWPYAGVLVAGTIVVGNAVFIPVSVIGLLRGSAGPGTGTASILLVGMAVVTLANVVLLAAAVARRLHDRGVSGWWAGVPAVLLCSGFVIFWLLMRSFDDDPGPGLFLLGFANNAVYFVVMIALVIQLALPGTPHANRFGPAPRVSR